MKRMFLVLTAMICSMSMNAQVMKVMKGESIVATYTAGQADQVVFEDGEIPEEHHDYVDLGLSVGWATCNVGASAPEKSGDYFAWGETKGYGKDTSDGRIFNWNAYKYSLAADIASQYLASYGYGKVVDDRSILDPWDDAVHANWGGLWRMPNSAEQSELLEKCTWTWTNLNGVNGYRVTSKTNGNSIFLPAAGYRQDTDLIDDGNGYYWSSTLMNVKTPYILYMEPNDFMSWSTRRKREHGLPVRGVYPKKEKKAPNPEYVDLGLSVKWATFNVGASAPEELGDYFAWGELIGYGEEASHRFDWANYRWSEGDSQVLTKYVTLSQYQNFDARYYLNRQDDAAHMQWGGSWQIPSFEQMSELIEKCTWTWTNLNGVNGYRVTSKTNGNSIFLPAGGFRDILGGGGNTNGFYWTYSIRYDYKDVPREATSLDFTPSSVKIGNTLRCKGLPIRAVWIR